jgi:hypothetical protein
MRLFIAKADRLGNKAGCAGLCPFPSSPLNLLCPASRVLLPFPRCAKQLLKHCSPFHLANPTYHLGLSLDITLSVRLPTGQFPGYVLINTGCLFVNTGHLLTSAPSWQPGDGELEGHVTWEACSDTQRRQRKKTRVSG